MYDFNLELRIRVGGCGLSFPGFFREGVLDPGGESFGVGGFFQDVGPADAEGGQFAEAFGFGCVGEDEDG